MRWTSALSENPVTARAVAEAAERCREALGPGDADLLLVFASPHHWGTYAVLPELVHEHLRYRVILGCSGGGVVGDGAEVEGGPALSITAARLPGVRLTPFHVDGVTLPRASSDPAVWSAVCRIRPGASPAFILLPDPFTFDARAMLLGLDAAFPASAKVGGLSSGALRPGGNALWVGARDDSSFPARTWRAGCAGLAIEGDIRLDTLVAQGCKPVGRPLVVSRCDGHRLFELEGRSPLVAVRELIDSLDDEDKALARRALFLGVSMAGDQEEYHAGDFLVRNIIGLDQQARAMVIGGELQPWQIVQFHVRDARASAADLRNHLERYRRGLSDGPVPEAAVLFSCLGRGVGLYGKASHDSGLAQELLGALPIGGFFCNGEIGPVNGTTHLHGYTSAFAIFRKGEPSS